jgi:hypothetical protein
LGYLPHIIPERIAFAPLFLQKESLRQFRINAHKLFNPILPLYVVGKGDSAYYI